MSQAEAHKQANQKIQLEGILSISLLRWLNKIKKSDTDIKRFEEELQQRLNAEYNKIIAKVSPATLTQLNHSLTTDETNVLATMLLTWAASNAIIRAAFITNTLQKWRDTMQFAEWKGRVQQHIKNVVVNTEVQPVFENTKHETAMFVGRATAFGKIKTKQWLTILDGKEREAHGDAYLQKVNIMSDFLVGGENLRYPGDPSGTLANIINCRCSMIFS